jgi:F0F1-type ATP synthase membrane subunit b/b'
METWQILWGINSFLLGVMAYFYSIQRDDNKALRNEIKESNAALKKDLAQAVYDLKSEADKVKNELKEEIAERTLIVTCETIHEEIEKKIHVHANSGTAGEVVR